VCQPVLDSPKCINPGVQADLVAASAGKPAKVIQFRPGGQLLRDRKDASLPAR